MEWIEEAIGNPDDTEVQSDGRIWKTVEFYTEVLSMEKEIFAGDRVALKFGEQKFNLHEIGKEFEPEPGVP